MRAEPASLELRIDYQFSHAELLRRALIHSSLANESHTGAGSTLDDNEQLEFLAIRCSGFSLPRPSSGVIPSIAKASFPA